jgi:predicted HTH transcriptional regulator
LALLGKEYGWEDPTDGVSPTEKEFDLATATGKHRLIFLKNLEQETQHPKMTALADRARKQLVYRRFDCTSDLMSLVYDSLIEHLEQRGVIHDKPFDAAVCRGATMADLATDKITWFLSKARHERNFGLSSSVVHEDVLTHLKLLDDGKLFNAAVLLFGRDPQKFMPSAMVKCARFRGTEIAKPIPAQRNFEGTLYDQVDGALDFVMLQLDRSIGTRAEGPSAPVTYEVPKDAVAEIIVNAVAHRDYTSNASVQVMVFSDRIEVWNPGHLPRGLTPDRLREPHPSEPANPFIARPLYLARYIESLGTGTLDVIQHCQEANLPAPQFEQRGSQFVVTLQRDHATATPSFSQKKREAVTLHKVRFERSGRCEVHIPKIPKWNDRQLSGIAFVEKAGRITNAEYQKLVGVTRKTAMRDLYDLIAKGVLVRMGEGRAVYYVFSAKK